MKFYLESNLETYTCFQTYQFIFFISSMVQNNMFSTKIRIKSTRIKSDKLNEFKSMTGDLSVFLQNVKESL